MTDAEEIATLRRLLAAQQEATQRAIARAERAEGEAAAFWTERDAARADVERLTRDRDYWQNFRALPAERKLTMAVEVIDEYKRAIGDHFAPNDCYATGPVTGDPFRDLVECPACSALAKHEKFLAELEKADG